MNALRRLHRGARAHPPTAGALHVHGCAAPTHTRDVGGGGERDGADSGEAPTHAHIRAPLARAMGTDRVSFPIRWNGPKESAFSFSALDASVLYFVRKKKMFSMLHTDAFVGHERIAHCCRPNGNGREREIIEPFALPFGLEFSAGGDGGDEMLLQCCGCSAQKPLAQHRRSDGRRQTSDERPRMELLSCALS